MLRILLTNDDGIHAPGLWEAAKALSRVGEVFVTAPDREQSGVGASLTLHAPVKVRNVPAEAFLEPGQPPANPVTAYAIEGTPGDSCLLGLEQLVKSVDLVVSGINTGSNLGWDIMVSGTVGAALQGYLRGFPTIAISVGSVQSPRFEGAARLLQLAARQLQLRKPLSPFFLNINVPSLPLEQIKGVQVTRLGGRSYGETVRPEGIGQHQRFWISRNRSIQADNGDGTDMWALKNNCITITPLQLSLSNHDQMPEIEALFSELPNQLLQPQD